MRSCTIDFRLAVTTNHGGAMTLRKAKSLQFDLQAS